jgi:hypothetical protein
MIPRYLGGGGTQAAAQQATAASPVALKAGDDITVVIYPHPGAAAEVPGLSRGYHLDETGTMVVNGRGDPVVIELAGLSPQDAAQRIADRLVEAELFRGPRVCLTGPGMTTLACADAKRAIRPEVAEKDAAFVAYLRDNALTEPPEAVIRYRQWLNDHRGSAEFMRMSPSDLWTRSEQGVRRPERPQDPTPDRAERWNRFIKAQQAADAKLPAQEQALAVETMGDFLDWFDRNRGGSDVPNADPATVYTEISIRHLRKRTEAAVRQKAENNRQAAAASPQAQEARAAKFDEFFAVCKKLWGYSTRTFPYSIPIDSQGQDILVTGDPALQTVLNALAGDLLRWATGHMSDTNYAAVSVNAVLRDLLQGGYSERISAAQSQPLAHETIDRNEILATTALAAFGETIATGLLAVAVVGLFVGAEIITAGAATGILVAYAGYSGFTSYAARRDEIERSGYHVPVPESILDAAGDVVGVSQLVEGITGERLGTGQPMGSRARSTQLGSGTGSIGTLLLGSRAYRVSQGIGRSLKPYRPGGTPSGPNALNAVRGIGDLKARPAVPEPNPAMGSVETARRAALPENLRAGLDVWSAEIRKKGGSPERVFERMEPERIRSQAEVHLKRYEAAVEEADSIAHEVARATDNPLRPLLRNVRPIRGTRVTVHYEKTPPDAHEISQAVELSRRTGEEIHLFGDTASGYNYPGIDGTIGEPPRPLQLKDAAVQAHPNLARKMAGDALLKAKDAQYTKVEVHIKMPGSTIAEVRAAWDAPPPLPSDPLPGAAFDGDVVTSIDIQCKDGTWTLTPPLEGPPLTGVSPLPARPQRDEGN